MENITIYGTYGFTIYLNEQTGYRVFTLETEQEVDEKYRRQGIITCSGVIPEYDNGYPLKVSGEFKPYKNISYTLQISSMEGDFTHRDGLVRYLMTERFKGVGRKKAELIVDALQPDFFENAGKEDTLEKIMGCGFKEDAATLILDEIKKTAEEKELIDIITAAGGTIEVAMKIHAAYGESSTGMLRTKPYDVCRTLKLPFRMADMLAKNNGMTYLTKERIHEIMLRALRINEQSGHTCVPFKGMLALCRQVEKEGAFAQQIPSMLYISQIQYCDRIVQEATGRECYLYTKKTFRNEENIVAQMKRLTRTSVGLGFSEDSIADAEKEMSMLFLGEQRDAFHILDNTSPCVLTGGPGRGKTTLLKGILDIYERMHPGKKIALCAPTGRAAQNLAEATGREASTIHKLLNYNPFRSGIQDEYSDVFEKNEFERLEADVIVIDEFSMVDTALFSSLLSAVKDSALVIMAGDENQLPSVSCGNVLHDIIAADAARVFRLFSVFRQSSDSIIIPNSDRILARDTNLESGKDFVILQFRSAEEMAEKATDLYRMLHERDKTIYDTQIISTTHIGPCGTKNINNVIQSQSGSVNGLKRFRVGDKVMTGLNCYTVDDGEIIPLYYNGEMGIVQEIMDDGSVSVLLGAGGRNERTIEISSENRDHLSLAYAVTVHKSMGSQFGTTIILLPSNPSKLLVNNMLYTAATRSRERVVLMYEGNAIEKTILTDSIDKRMTGLARKLEPCVVE